MPSLKRVTNSSEESAFQELQTLAGEYGYHVNIKMCVQDALNLRNWQASPKLSSFARDSHFDFLICDANNFPIFAVEFDGPQHATNPIQIERDNKKNKLCEMFELPLLRINGNHIVPKYNQATLLKWIISAWELQKSFDDTQEKGIIPYDEGFDPIMLSHSGTTVEQIHPHWLSLKPRQQIQKFHQKGILPFSHTCGVTFTNENDSYVGVEWIDVAKDKIVYVKSGLRAQQFPLYFGDLFSEVIAVLLYERLLEYLKSGVESVSPETVSNWLNSAKHKYNFAGCHSGPTCVNFSFSWDSSGNKWF